ncbi:hypothetical protein BN14_10718 [Rhizoctonia solani AG-1 IB]|uniref:Protein kinase domain-containing protein n=1 Tax=Thanatephorus cucumeris (strain AG1-IB / isolate 7/3/14) TaxID=1108050 RepID=M5C996_THACB|nr:hypothetical protein BN14_10718 [Rhizoctonia solani AG-1 IB]
MDAAISPPTLTYSIVICIHSQEEALADNEQSNLPEHGKTLKRVAREMYTWSCCEHQGVLPVLGFAQFMGQIAVVTPWMEDGSLQQQILRGSLRSPLQTCIELAIAVEHLHEKGVVHGDIKPAPEVLKEQSVPPTTESDVYALGMTMYNIMGGSLPFADKWEPLVIVEVLSKKGQPSRPSLDHSLLSNDAKVKMWDLLQSCFAYEPGDRLKASQVKDALMEIRGLENTHIRHVKTK